MRFEVPTVANVTIRIYFIRNSCILELLIFSFILSYTYTCTNTHTRARALFLPIHIPSWIYLLDDTFAPPAFHYLLLVLWLCNKQTQNPISACCISSIMITPPGLCYRSFFCFMEMKSIIWRRDYLCILPLTQINFYMSDEFNFRCSWTDTQGSHRTCKHCVVFTGSLLVF